MKTNKIYNRIVPPETRSLIRRKILKRDYSLSYEELFKKKRVIFIHIPKTAGISVSKALFDRDSGGHQPLQYFKDNFSPRVYKKCFKFTFVRHPYTRFISAYLYLKSGGRGSSIDKNYMNKIDNYIDINEFIEDFSAGNRFYEFEHFVPQVDWIKTSCGKIETDFIGRFENLQEDFKTICRILKVDTCLCLNNNSDYKSREADLLLTKESKRILETFYSEDFEKLGYQ